MTMKDILSKILINVETIKCFQNTMQYGNDTFFCLKSSEFKIIYTLLLKSLGSVRLKEKNFY